MTKFTCVSISPSFPVRITERNAETADAAADAAATAIHKAYFSEYWRDGGDIYGDFREYSIKETAKRIHSTVRVYSNYKYVSERAKSAR